MKTFRPTRSDTEILEKIACDCCSTEYIANKKESMPPPITNFAVDFNFGSEFDQGSMDPWAKKRDLDIDICDSCLKTWLISFKIRPSFIK